VDPEPLSEKIRDGVFLDVSGTNYYKALQLAEICKRCYEGQIKNNDVFLFHDLWYPGLEMLAYIRDGMGINFKIAGILHAGSYDPHDMLAQKGMGWWAKSIEEGWMRFIDRIFVATDFHKRMLITSRDVNPNKIVVTGLPSYYEQHSSIKKENIVVFPHRLDKEKNPHLFDDLRRVGIGFEKGWRYAKTKTLCTTKQGYYDFLEKTKIAVSFANQETWGYAMQEALFARNIPVVPDRLSYVELYESPFRFSSFSEAVAIIKNIILNYEEYYSVMDYNRIHLLRLGEQAIPNMIEECRKL
jgi:hypothetical protein